MSFTRVPSVVRGRDLASCRAFFGRFVVTMLILAGVGVAADGDTGKTIDAREVAASTGVQWQQVTLQQADGVTVVRGLAVPYPAGTKAPTQIGEDAAAQTARDFVLAHAQLFAPGKTKVTEGQDDVAITEVIANTHARKYPERGTDYTVVMQQRYGGVPVFDSACRVSLTRTGQLWKVKNGFALLADPPTTPTLTATAALKVVRKALGDAAAKPEAAPQLCILPPAQLTWSFSFLQPHFRDMLVDAITGQVVLSRKNVRDAPPEAPPAPPPTIIPDSTPNPPEVE